MFFRKNKIKVIKNSPIQQLCEKYDIEENIKNDLKKQNIHIQSIYIDEEEISIKFIEQKHNKNYEVTPEEIFYICTYLGSFNYTICSNYGVVIKFNIKNIDIVEDIELIKITDKNSEKVDEKSCSDTLEKVFKDI